jgi:quercetin dioxygenase-like cupin family protein
MVHRLSGDPETGAFNAIVKIPAGMKIPLHTHSAHFNGVTLTDGIVHASQTGADKPLPKGSAWSQPANEAHIDECHSDTDCILLVFFDGAIDTHFVDTPAEDPKMVVTPADQIAWKAVRPEMENSPRMAVISGNPKTGAFSALLELPAGMSTNVHSHTANFVGSIISGTHKRGTSADALFTLTHGAVWSEKSGAPHMEQCGSEEPCIIALQMDGALDEKQVKLTTAQASN